MCLRFVFPILALLIAANSASGQSGADQTAVTESGQRVVLHSNGTWSAVKDSLVSPKADDVQSFDFRNARWGMSRSQVRKTESDVPSKENDDILLYSTKVVGLDAIVGYKFVMDSLVSARYVSTERHANNTDFIGDFRSICSALSEKYGNAATTDTVWKDDLYKDDPSHWGMAIATGGMFMYAIWRLQASTIHCQLQGDNYKLTLMVDYESVALQHLIDKKEKAAKSKGL